MNLAEIQSRVAKIVEEELEATGVGLANEPSDFGADEVDSIEIVMSLEDEFRGEISDDNPMYYEDAKEVHKLKSVDLETGESLNCNNDFLDGFKQEV